MSVVFLVGIPLLGIVFEVAFRIDLPFVSTIKFRLLRKNENLTVAGMILVLGLFVLCLATFGGVVLIGPAHILIAIGIMIQVGRNVAIKKERRFFSEEKITLSSWFLLVFLVICLISILVHWGDYQDGIGTAKKLRYVFLVLLVLYIPGCTDLLSSRVVRIIALSCVSLSIFVVCVPSIVSHHTGFNLITGEALKYGRASGVSGTILTFSYTLQFFILLIAAIVLSGKMERRWLDETIRPGIARWVGITGLWTVLLLALFFSESRGAIIGVLAGGGVLAVVLRKRWLMITGAACVLVLAVIALASGSRLLDYRDPVRMTIWKTASLTFLDHPLLGVGYRGLEEKSDQLAEQYGVPPLSNRERKSYYFKGHAHNNFLEAFAGMGILGGLAFLGFCGAWLYECSRTPGMSLFILPSVVAFCVSGLFESTFIDAEVVNVVMLFYLASQLAYRRRHGSSHSPRTPGDKQFPEIGV